jgi:anhydro-N-acetylmuramic acid kinase
MMAVELFIGLMSGTSLDGVDAALVEFKANQPLHVLHTHFLSYPASLRAEILALQHPTENELETTALLANTLARLYADAVIGLLNEANVKAKSITAIGCHGQTIRHRPELGFTLQIGNAALLTELTGITVVSDFRSRDIAAGGQGAPLVPAFHKAVLPTLILTAPLSILAALPILLISQSPAKLTALIQAQVICCWMHGLSST